MHHTPRRLPLPALLQAFTLVLMLWALAPAIAHAAPAKGDEAAMPTKPHEPDATSKPLERVRYTRTGEGGADYTLSQESDFETQLLQVLLSRTRAGKNKESSEVAPALFARVADIARKHGADGWNGFAAAEWSRETPGAFELIMRYSSGQEIWVRGLQGSAAPKGYAAFERELLAALDETLDGTPGTPRAAPRQGLKSLEYVQRGMAVGIAYRIYTRREAGRDVFRLMHALGSSANDYPISDEELAALETLAERLNLAALNGVYSDSTSGMQDGEKQSLLMEYSDGRRISTSAIPGETRYELTRFLDAILAKHPSKDAPE